MIFVTNYDYYKRQIQKFTDEELVDEIINVSFKISLSLNNQDLNKKSEILTEEFNSRKPKE